MTQKNQQLPIQGLDDHDAFLIAPQFCPNARNVRSLRNRITRAPGGTLLAPVPLPAVNPGVGMVTGMFTMNTSTGAQVITHNLGASPVALILYTEGSTALNHKDSSLKWSMGFTDGTNTRSAAFASNSGSPSATGRRYSTSFLVIVNQAGTVLSQATYTAWTSSTFTINWGTVDGVARKIGYSIFGHASLSAKLLEWTFGAATGNQAVVGAGFTPSLVFHMTAAEATATGGTGAQFGFGMMAAGFSRFSTSAISQNGVAGHNAHSQSGAALIMLNPSGSAVQYAAEYVSMDVDGFTVNRTTAPATGQLVASLCFSGFTNVKVANLPFASTTVPQRSSVTTVGFLPTGMFFVGGGTSDSGQGFELICGAADGVNQDVIAAEDDIDNSSTIAAVASTDAVYIDAGLEPDGLDRKASLVSFDPTGLTINITVGPAPNFSSAVWTLPGTAAAVGVIRNYSQPYVGLTTAVEKMVMLTSKSAFIYTPSTPTTGIWSPTAEVYTGTDLQRFSIANTQGLVAWSQGKDNIRQWDGTTFGPLVTTGTDHAARALLAFADRIVSVRPYYAGADHPTQIRWCRNGIINDWGGTGSGSLEIIETSQDPLITGFVLGDRAYLAKRRELIELIWTGTDSPVFGTQPRVRGMGILAPHSVGLAEQLAFWLGEDDIYMFDGSTMTAVGERIYHTITSLIDYTDVNLDQIQATVFTPDSQYWLVVPPYVFIYDYRRDIWDWDDARNFQAIGTFNVGSNFTGDIDRSQFVVLGDSSVQSIREDPSINTYLGDPIDSYFETKDYTAEELLQSYGFKVTLWDLNSLRELRFQSVPGYVVEVGSSTDRGVTYDTQNVTVNAQGVGVAWFQLAFSQVRFRFRRYSTDGYEIHGQWGVDWETAGYQYP